MESILKRELKVSYHVNGNFPETACSPADTPTEMAHLFRKLWDDSFDTQESFYIALWCCDEFIGWRKLCQGTSDAVLVDLKALFQIALSVGATHIAVAHNHPLGEPDASEADLKCTLNIAQAAKIFDMRLLDHIILGKNEFVSLQEDPDKKQHF